MWLFLASDCLFFGSLIAAYLLYRDRSVQGPYPDELFDIPFTSVSAFVLLMSSVSMVLALAAIQRGDSARHADLAIRDGRCSAYSSSPGRRTSSRSSTTRA